MDPEGGGGGTGSPDPPLPWKKSQLDIGFLKNAGMVAFGLNGPNCFWREIRTALCEIG